MTALYTASLVICKAVVQYIALSGKDSNIHDRLPTEAHDCSKGVYGDAIDQGNPCGR